MAHYAPISPSSSSMSPGSRFSFSSASLRCLLALKTLVLGGEPLRVGGGAFRFLLFFERFFALSLLRCFRCLRRRLQRPHTSEHNVLGSTGLLLACSADHAQHMQQSVVDKQAHGNI